MDRTRPLRRSSPALALLALWCIAAAPGPQGKRTAVPDARLQAHVQLEQTGATLSQALAELRKQAGINVLADGAPRANSIDLRFQGPAGKALDYVAASFDYAWAPSRSGVLLMYKRYHSRDERPQTNAPELLRVAKDIVAICGLTPHGSDDDDWGMTLVQLAQTFTPGQAAALQAGQRILYRDLAPGQQALVRAALATRTFGPPATSASDLAAKLSTLGTSFLRFGLPRATLGDRAGTTYQLIHVAGTASRPLATPLSLITIAAKERGQ